MANPTVGDVHVSTALTNISIAYMQDPMGFVADRVFPNIPVQKQADKYFRYDRADFMRNQYVKRAPGSESAGSGFKVDSSATYFAEEWSLHKDIPDSLRANQDVPLNSDRDATNWLAQQALISREVNWASKYFTTGVWTGIDGTATDVTGVSSSPSTNQVLQWNDASSTPIADIKAYADTVHQLTGMRPNKLVIGRQVWSILSEHADVIDRIKYSAGATDPAVVTKKAFAALCEIDEVMVMDGIQVTSNENPDFETSKTAAFIAGKNALLTYAAPRPSLWVPSGGYTFSWVGRLGAGALGNRIKKFRMEHLESDRVEGQMAYDQKVVCSDCGVFFSGIIA